MIKKKLSDWILILIFCGHLFCLNACTISTPPLEFAPDGKIINQAIILQLKQTQINLSYNLKAPIPSLEINQIKVKQIKPMFINKLPVYHLQGTYNLSLKYPSEKIKQKNNKFDIYLQRQQEGKSWRLLRKNHSLWKNYLISTIIFISVNIRI